MIKFAHVTLSRNQTGARGIEELTLERRARYQPVRLLNIRTIHAAENKMRNKPVRENGGRGEGVRISINYGTYVGYVGTGVDKI